MDQSFVYKSDVFLRIIPFDSLRKLFSNYYFIKKELGINLLLSKTETNYRNSYRILSILKFYWNNTNLWIFCFVIEYFWRVHFSILKTSSFFSTKAFFSKFCLWSIKCAKLCMTPFCFGAFFSPAISPLPRDSNLNVPSWEGKFPRGDQKHAVGMPKKHLLMQRRPRKAPFCRLHPLCLFFGPFCMFDLFVSFEDLCILGQNDFNLFSHWLEFLWNMDGFFELIEVLWNMILFLRIVSFCCGLKRFCSKLYLNILKILDF